MLKRESFKTKSTYIYRIIKIFEHNTVFDTFDYNEYLKKNVKE